MKHSEAVHRMRSMKKGVHKNFAKFTGKHLCQSLLFNKGAERAFIFSEKLSRKCFTRSYKRL